MGKAYDEVIQTISQKYPQARLHGVAVQKMARRGAEVITGIYKDAQFGAALMFGPGGIMVEVFKDVTFRIVPLARKDVAESQGNKGLSFVKGLPRSGGSGSVLPGGYATQGF